MIKWLKWGTTLESGTSNQTKTVSNKGFTIKGTVKEINLEHWPSQQVITTKYMHRIITENGYVQYNRVY